MTAIEWRAALSIALIFFCRMMGLFMLLPVMALYADELKFSTLTLVGIAIGIYGLGQALFQIPLGLLSDRIGRKPVIVFGLSLFLMGGIVAAYSETIYGVIAGRALQGVGAIASASLALLADLTQEQNRSKAMALVGISIGGSFVLALLLGPVFVGFGGLHGLFLASSALAMLAIFICLFVVPNKKRAEADQGPLPATQSRFVSDQISAVLANGELLKLALSVFVLHLIMTSNFIAVPIILKTIMNMPVSDHWRIYLPVFFISLMLMGPFMRHTSDSTKLRKILKLAVLVLGLAQLLLALAFEWIYALSFAFVFFFAAFNLLEALLPTLVSKVANEENRGTAMGVFSSAQFLGAFAGGSIGGLLFQRLGASGIFFSCCVMSGIWLWFVIMMKPFESPESLSSSG